MSAKPAPIRRQLTLADSSCSPEQDDGLLNPIAHPLLSYFGGKWKQAPQIIENFRPHKIYTEAYGGGGSVLLRKLKAETEIYNEINPRVRNLFTCLLDDPERVIWEVSKLGYSKDCLHQYWEGSEDKWIDAAQYYRHSCLNHAGSGTNWCTGFGRDSARTAKRRGDSHLWAIAKRLEGVTIRGDDAIAIIQEYDSPDTLHYLDPTYLPGPRNSKDSRHKNQKESAPRRQYAYEMTAAEHVELLQVVLNCQGQVVLSGYPSKLYADLLETNGWERVDQESTDSSGATRIESLWLSPSGPVEIQRRRAKGYRLPKSAVSVARPSRWGNPFTIAWAIDKGCTAEAAQAFAADAFAEWLENSPFSEWDGELITYQGRSLREHHAFLKPQLEQLRGKSLACFCPLGTPCHRQPLLERANFLTPF